MVAEMEVVGVLLLLSLLRLAVGVVVIIVFVAAVDVRSAARTLIFL